MAFVVSTPQKGREMSALSTIKVTVSQHHAHKETRREREALERERVQRLCANSQFPQTPFDCVMDLFGLYTPPQKSRVQD